MKTVRNQQYLIILKHIGLFFKNCRIKKNQKLYAVAISIGMTHPVISKIENGKYLSLNIKVISKLLNYYNKDFSLLFSYLLDKMSLLQNIEDNEQDSNSHRHQQTLIEISRLIQNAL